MTNVILGHAKQHSKGEFTLEAYGVWMTITKRLILANIKIVDEDIYLDVCSI